MSQLITISKRFTFEASHVLPQHPGKCARLHGHSWVLTVEVCGPVDMRTGFVMDFDDLKKVVHERIVDRVDHQHLGWGQLASSSGLIHPPFGDNFYPTSENLVVLFAARLPAELFPEQVRLSRVLLEETCTSAAEWRGVE